jgi:PRC-barrel domain
VVFGFGPFKVLLLAGSVLTASPCVAQQSDDNASVETQELTLEIIGARVSDFQGAEIGEVADICFDEEGQPDRLRVRASASLGFGERTVEISRGAYMLLRGHVVLDISADDIRTLPDVSDEFDDKRVD